MTKTPEGFLICHNVPIARTGWQDYLPREIGLPGDSSVKVYRSEEEVFSPGTIASFEAKAVTDDHPAQDVRPDNIAAYGKGHAQNVHRGSGDQSDMLLADLVITDPILISEIESGKREVSCGYDCNYVPRDDGQGYDQVGICGNHVAIVERGRAGPQVAIQDSKPKTRGGKKMKIDRDTLLGKILKAFSQDAEPEELAAAHEMLGEKKEPAKDEELHNEQSEENFNAQILAAIKALQADVAEIKAGKTAPEVKDALSELEEEMTNGKPDDPTTDENAEESVTIPAEEMENQDGSKVMDAKTTDKAAILATIKAVKPIIAGLPAAERKKASDALTKELRAAMQKPAPTQDAYTEILKRKKVADAKAGEPGDFGKNCAKHNPHMKKEGK
jgi:hypothetical protein